MNTKKKSKAKTIYQAFTSGDDVDESIKNYRLSICDKCEHNSKNSKDDKLLDTVQRRLKKGDFCKICRCYIDEKTGQSTEACGLENIGEKPLWNRVLVETTNSGDFNVINRSPKDINIDLKDGNYIIDLGKFEKNKVQSYSISLDFKDIKALKSINSSCSMCLSMEVYARAKNKFDIDLNVNYHKNGIYEKYIIIKYLNEKSELKVVKIKLIGDTL